MKTFLFAFLFLISGAIDAFSQEIPKIRINPDIARGGDISNFFNDIEYIPLETTKESLFGEITEMALTSDSYVVYDWDTKSILFFNKNGRFLRKRTFSSDASIGISYIKHSNSIVVNVGRPPEYKSEIFCFSSIGHPIEPLQTSKIKELENSGKLRSIGDGFFVASGNCYLAPGKNPSTDTTYLLSVYKNNSFYKGLMPVTQASNSAICMLHGYLSLGNVVQDGLLYVAMPLTNIVYKVTKDTAQAAFQLVFPRKRVLDVSIIQENSIKEINAVGEALQNNTETILTVSNIFYRKKDLFFKVNPRLYSTYAGSNSEGQYNFIYDTVNGSLASLERMQSDSTSYYLPIFGQNLRRDGLYYADDNVFTSVSSLQMFTAHEANKDRNPKYPDLLQNYFETQTRKSNPVIVRMKLKE